MKFFLFFVLSFFAGQIISAQTTIFSENMGTPATTTSIVANVFQNSGTQTYTGTADVRSTTPSAGYVGASGSGNVFITTTIGTNFQISNINTSGYTALTLSFGHHKSSTTGNNELIIEVSSDGTTYTPLTYSRATGSGTATWTLITASGTIPAVPNLRIRFRQTTTATAWRIDDILLVGTLSAPCVVGPAPTTLSSNGNANPFCTSAGLSFTAGNGSNHLVVMSTSPITGTPVNATAYTSNTTFGSGATIGAGQFVVFNGSTTSFTVTGLTANTTYYVAVFEFNMTSSNCDESYNTSPLTYNFTTLNNCSTPQIRSLLADACSSQEGLDELVLIENGSNPLNISDISLAFPAGGTYCNSGCGTNTLGNNPAYITQLNTLAGCPLFAYADPIPAGATIIVFTGQTPSYVFDYSTQCPSTEVFYAIFCNNTSTSGRFANSGNAGTRTLTANFAGTTESVTYTPNLLGSNGSFVDFDDAGNPTYRTEANCIYPLGVELVNFNAAKMDQKVLLSWATLVENNSGHFNILRSTDGKSFDVIGKLFAQGISHTITNYSFEDGSTVNGLAYYQLEQIDRNGERQYSKQIAVDMNFNEIVARYHEGNIQFNEVLLPGETVSVYTSTGQVIFTQEITTVSSTLEVGLSQGVYHLLITKKGSGQARIKCPVTQ
jgi:hypothetical protein